MKLPQKLPPRSAFLALALLIIALVGTAATQADERGVGSATWTPPPYDQPSFQNIWYDGHAELASYALTYPRYGELRTGTAVAITVTEPFNPDKRVKADRVEADSYNVIKLNLVEDFQTGVYDYNLMTSVFAALEPANGLPAGAATKVSFSSQEWCGHVYQQALFSGTRGGKNGVQHTSHSYFETEADEAITLDHPKGGVAEDGLILWARGLAGPSLKPGEKITVPVYRSMAIQRLLHKPVAWDSATLTHEQGDHTIQTALGTYACARLTAKIQSDVGDREYTFYVDQTDAGHRRLITMQRSDGYSLSLTGVDRMTYWSQHGNQEEAALKRLNLTRRADGSM